MIVRIYLHPGGIATCPECSGVLKLVADNLVCTDCHASYRIEGVGKNEHTVTAAMIWRPQNEKEEQKND